MPFGVAQPGSPSSAELSRRGGRVPTPPVTRRALLPHSDTSRTRPSLPKVSPRPTPLIDSLLQAGTMRPPQGVSISPSIFPTVAGRGADMARISEKLAGETVDHYRIESPLGQGASGFVFRAHDLRAGEPVALKLFDRERMTQNPDQDAFIREAERLSRIASPFVVKVVGAGVSLDLVASVRPTEPLLGPGPFLAMELLEGEDLRAMLQKHGAIPAAEALSHLRDVANALDVAHAANIVHCDLKPGNLFLTQVEGRQGIKLLDFGRTQVVGKGFFGTAWYMAPEQVQGAPVSPATDRWALAVVAFRLLTSESYWSPAPMSDLLAAIVAGPKLAPSAVAAARGVRAATSIGPAFDNWFKRACDVVPAMRFHSCREQIDALTSALEEDAHSRKEPVRGLDLLGTETLRRGLDRPKE